MANIPLTATLEEWLEITEQYCNLYTEIYKVDAVPVVDLEHMVRFIEAFGGLYPEIIGD